MALTTREKELVAIGSSIGGNCIPCLEWHYNKCKELGLSKEEMQDAIAMAKKVKEVPNKKIYEAADKLVGEDTNNPSSTSCCCPDTNCCS